MGSEMCIRDSVCNSTRPCHQDWHRYSRAPPTSLSPAPNRTLFSNLGDLTFLSSTEYILRPSFSPASFHILLLSPVNLPVSVSGIRLPLDMGLPLVEAVKRPCLTHGNEALPDAAAANLRLDEGDHSSSVYECHKVLDDSDTTLTLGDAVDINAAIVDQTDVTNGQCSLHLSP